jgi:hypothetical protein
MTSTGNTPEDTPPAAAPTAEIPAATAPAAEPTTVAEPAAAPPAAPATAPQPVAAAAPSPWPPAGPVGQQPTRVRAAWLRLLTPLPAAVLAVALVLAGFGLGVVVGWHHDNGPRVERVGFGPGQREFGPGQRGFGPGQGFGRQGQQGQQGQPGQPGQRQQPAQPLPTPSATTS